LLGNSFAVFGEDFSGVFVEGLFGAPAADVVVLAFVADLDRAFAAGDNAFGIAGSPARRVPAGVQSTIFIDFRYEEAAESLI
jgi:hypothetical protein